LEDRDAQVYRAALKFAKVVVFVVDAEDLQSYMPQVLRLFENRHVSSAKMLVRKIVERIVKLVPPEALADAFPKEHQALLTYVQRQLIRKQRPQSMTKIVEDEDEEEGDAEMEDAKKKPKQKWDDFDKDDPEDEDDEGKSKKRGKRARGAEDDAKEPATSAVMAHEAVQSLLDAWEAESDDEMEGGAGKSRKSKRKRGEAASSTWIHEDGNMPLDFMSADAAHSVLTVRPPQLKRHRGQAEGAAGAENRTDALRRHGLRFAADGRLVVDEEAEERKDDEGEEGKGKKFNVGVATPDVKPLSRLAAMRASRAKAKASSRAERKNGHIIKGLDAYKPGNKRSGGDAQRKSDLDPFAYVRLNPKVTKEKFRGKATASFAKIIKGQKKGVLKGNKAKIRDAKQKTFKHAQKRRRHSNKDRPTNAR